MIPKIYAENEFFLKNKLEKQINNAVEKLGLGLKPSIKFSNNLRVISVDLITQSAKPFYKNIEINHDLDKGIKDIAKQKVLSDMHYRMVEEASTDANFLNRYGRLHKEGQTIDYYTASPFIFSIEKQLLDKNLANVETELNTFKSKPIYRQAIHLDSSANASQKTIRFLNPTQTKEHDLHQVKYYGEDEDIPSCEYSSVTEQAVFYDNTFIMGATLELKKANGLSAILHVPRCYMDGFDSTVSGYTIEPNGSRNGFVYYDWFIAEQGLLRHLRYGDLKDEANSINYIKSYLRYDVDVKIHYHKKVYTLPTANYAPVQAIDFLAMVMDNNSIEAVLIRVKRSGEILVLNSRLKPIVLPDNNHLNLGFIREHLEGLFSSNRTYVFYLINEIRKTMGAVNVKFSKQENYIFLP